MDNFLSARTDRLLSKQQRKLWKQLYSQEDSLENGGGNDGDKGLSGYDGVPVWREVEESEAQVQNLHRYLRGGFGPGIYV